MLLADYAVVSDGKLTIVGGGWSQTGPEPASFGIGLLIQVPWDQANTRHTFSVELLDADGSPIGFEDDEESDQVVAFGGEFEVGRPPGRSEERRVGKECRSLWSPEHYKASHRKGV